MLLIGTNLDLGQKGIIASAYTHTFGGFGDVLLPTTQIPKAETFKAEFQTTLIVNQFAHQVFVSLNGFQIRRSEEHTSELQSRPHLVCRLLLEKKKKKKKQMT